MDYDARSSEARVDPLPAGPWFADLGQVQGEGGMAIGFASDRWKGGLEFGRTLGYDCDRRALYEQCFGNGKAGALSGFGDEHLLHLEIKV